jgi:hypothetical protein
MPPTSYFVGQKVLAQYGGSEEFYSGQITHIQKQKGVANRFAIDFDDGDKGVEYSQAIIIDIIHPALILILLRPQAIRPIPSTPNDSKGLNEQPNVNYPFNFAFRTNWHFHFFRCCACRYLALTTKEDLVGLVLT